MIGDDTLSRVALSHSAVKRWHAKAGAAPDDLAATLLSGLVEDDPKDGRSTIGDRS